jgi:hypothetical protein
MDLTKYQSNAAIAPPDPPASFSTGYPTNGDPGIGQAPTHPGDYWFYQVAAEINAVVVAAGLTPSATTLNQLLTAIQFFAILNSEFRVTKNGAPQTIATSTHTKLTFESVVVDSGSEFTGGTTFTAAEDGIYFFSVCSKCTPIAVSGGALVTSLWINGVLTASNTARFADNTTTSSTVVLPVVALSAGDTVEAYAWQDTGNNQPIDGGFSNTYFSGFRIR